MEQWQNIVKSLEDSAPAVYALLRSCEVYYDGDVLTILAKHNFHYWMLKSPRHLEPLRRAVAHLNPKARLVVLAA